MKLYEYHYIIGDDVVIHQGFITATSEPMMMKRLETEIHPKVKVWDRVHAAERKCECGSDDDVIDYHVGSIVHVKCRGCRFDHVIQMKKAR